MIAGLVSSVGRAPDLQAGGRGFESCIGHTFSFLVYCRYITHNNMKLGTT